MSVAVSAPRARSAGRLVVAAALAIAAAALIATEATTRAAEAVLAGEFIGLVAPGRAVAAGPIVWFGIGTDEVTGLVITTMCSTTVLAVPLLLLGVAITGITRAPTGRVGLGLLVGLALAVTCNMIRFASAAWAYSAYGREGFDLVHRYVGSLFVILGFILATVLLLRIALRESGARRTARPRTEWTPEVAASGSADGRPRTDRIPEVAASGSVDGRPRTEWTPEVPASGSADGRPRTERTPEVPASGSVDQSRRLRADGRRHR